MNVERFSPSSKSERQNGSARSLQTPSRETQRISHQTTATLDGMSIVYQPPISTASIESTLEALRLSAEAEPDSSIEFILTPPRHPRHSDPLARSAAGLPADDARPRSVSAELPRRIQKAANPTPKTLIRASDLNPEVAPFRVRDSLAPVSAASFLAQFHEIVKEGKNLIGELRFDAKAALADLGLKPIPSLHGSAQLPYARNPSGIDSFHFSVEEDEEAFTPTDDACGVRARPGPLPLPGNARYTNAGRLGQQRMSSAPAVLVSSGTSTICSTTRSPLATVPSPPSRASPRRRKQVSQSALAFDDAATVAVQPLMTIPPNTNIAAPSGMDEQAIAQAAVAAQQRQMAQQAQQAHFAQQAQLMLLAAQTQAPQSQSSRSAGRAYAPPYASIVPGFSFPSARPDQEQNNMPAISSSLAGLTSYPFSPPPVDSARRQSIVIGPDGHIDVVDSLAVLSLTHQQRHATRSKRSATSLAPSSEPSLAKPSLSAERAASAVQPIPVSTDPPHALAASRTTEHAPHRRSDSDTGLTKKAYLEKGRRKSTAPHFPSRRAARKGSLPLAIHVLPVTPSNGLEAAGMAKVPRTSVDQLEPRRAFADIANRLPIVHEPFAEGGGADAPASHNTVLPISEASSAAKSKGKKPSSRKKLVSPILANSAGSPSVRGDDPVLKAAHKPVVDDAFAETAGAVPAGGSIGASKRSGKRRAKAGRSKALLASLSSEAI